MQLMQLPCCVEAQRALFILHQRAAAALPCMLAAIAGAAVGVVTRLQLGRQEGVEAVPSSACNSKCWQQLSKGINVYNRAVVPPRGAHTPSSQACPSSKLGGCGQIHRQLLAQFDPPVYAVSLLYILNSDPPDGQAALAWAYSCSSWAPAAAPAASVDAAVLRALLIWGTMGLSDAPANPNLPSPCCPGRANPFRLLIVR